MNDLFLVTKTFDPGQVIFKEGEPGIAAYIIRKGCVSVCRTENGQRIHLATRSEGEVVGEMALMDDTVRSATVIAESLVEVQVLTKQKMAELLAESPPLIGHVLHQVLESLRVANDMVMEYAMRLSGETGRK